METRTRREEIEINKRRQKSARRRGDKIKKALKEIEEKEKVHR
jgi:hypothetical protein